MPVDGAANGPHAVAAASAVEELDDSEGTTMGSAPASPCLWRATGGDRNDYGADRNDRSDDDDDGGRKDSGDRGTTNRVSLNALFRKASPVPRTTRSPQAGGRLSQTKPSPSSLWSSPPPVSELRAAPVSRSPSPGIVQSVLPKLAPSRLTKAKLPAKPRALVLSPMSQLNVLSQISEMADLQAATPVPKPKLSSQQDANSEQPHVWAPALKPKTKKRKADSIAISKPSLSAKTSQRRASRPVPAYSEAIVKDMLDWETCSGNGSTIPFRIYIVENLF